MQVASFGELPHDKNSKADTDNKVSKRFLDYQSMSISVVIPAYQAARTIRRAVDSVLGQTLLPEEILVVNDGSPDVDELATALIPYGSSVRLIHKANGGAASARNCGIEHATGEWIAFLDADDYWEPEKLALQQAVLVKFPEVEVVGCRWYKQEPGQERTPDAFTAAEFSGRVLSLTGSEAFRAATSILTSSLMIKTSVLREDSFVSGFEPAEDRDLWFRLLNRHKAYILPDFLETYVQEPGGISRVNIDRDCVSMLFVIQRHAHLIGSSATKRQTSIVYRRWSAVHLAAGRPSQALPRAVERLRRQPLTAQAWWITMKAFLLAARETANRRTVTSKN